MTKTRVPRLRMHRIQTMPILTASEGFDMGMTRHMILAILTATLVVAQCNGQSDKPQDKDKSPTLEATLNFMQKTLARYTYLHKRGKDQELNLKAKEPCRIYVEWQITVKMNTPQDGVYPVEYQFHLGNMDPESVKVTTDTTTQKEPNKGDDGAYRCDEQRKESLDVRV